MAAFNGETATRVSSIGMLRSELPLASWPDAFDGMPRDAIVWLSPTDEAGQEGTLTLIQWIEGPLPVEAVMSVPQAVLGKLPFLTEMHYPPDDLSSLGNHQVRFFEGPVVDVIALRSTVKTVDLAFTLADEWLAGRHPVQATLKLFEDSLLVVPASDAAVFLETYKVVASGVFDQDDEHHIASMCVALAYLAPGEH